MAKDWASDVKKFVPDADDGVIAGIVRYCGIALQKPDSSLVSYGDPVELGRVRNNFLKKKLALTDSDEVLDAAIARVGERMKGVNFKNRVTVYYLLLEDLNLLDRFRKAPAPAKGTKASAGGAAAGGAAALAAAGAATAVSAEVPKPVAATVVDPAPVVAPKPAAAPAPVASVAAVAATATAGVAVAASAPTAAVSAPRALAGPGLGSGFATDDGAGKGGYGFLLWAIVGGLLLLAVAMLFWLFTNYNRPVAPVVASSASVLAGTASAPAAPAPTTPAPVDPSTVPVVAVPPVVAPDGAGIVSETRDAKPVVKVYFDTGKSVVAPTFATATEPLKAYLTANPGSIIAVSGFNDPTGNAAANAALSKRRAEAVKAQLVAAGVPATSVELIKPKAATDTGTTAAEARRVEAYIK